MGSSLSPRQGEEFKKDDSFYLGERQEN
jgi:hypothetical protein